MASRSRAFHVLRKWAGEGRLSPAQQTVVEPLPEEQLFAVDTDPFEIHNLADAPAHADTLAQMPRRLGHWIEESGDQGRDPDSPAIIAAFEEYGRQSAARYAKGYEKLRTRVFGN